MRAILLAAVIGAALAFPATTLAVNCAPPGTSGVDQYLETIPGASCNAAFPFGAGRGEGTGGGHGLTPGTARALQAQGTVGLAVERLVAATGTAGELAGRTGRAGGNSPPSGGRASGARSGYAISAVRGQSLPSALLGPLAPDGSGLLVPILVAAGLLLAVGGAVARRRARRST